MSNDKYYVMDTTLGLIDGMALDSMPDLPNEAKDDWMYGQAFTKAPKEPIIVDISDDEENNIPVSFYSDPPVATNEFIGALLEVGIDNLAIYDAVLRSWPDGEVEHKDYKAFNIIGLVKAAGPETEFATESRDGDASITKLQADTSAIKGLYMFRLAESWDTIVVHEKVKNHLESKSFIGLKFKELDGAFIL
ncbi:hypothetical protein CXF85_09205 [Colwellia sp. 75C3]|uniref:hypothetical protein n=1 Tax=Colwellia sp. 75C3 TaxID=888425 RepID=UPI000C339DBD|nr:hypothetical protein [Colwellia sp. 75C3]PKG84087.1 hypothetical protein CXF85_09205 [Colwellia sp. 75C3]